MTSDLLRATCVALCLVALPASAHAQRSGVRAEASDDNAVDRFRVRAGLEVVTRRFDLVGPTDVNFVAPYYRGLRIELEAFPIAWFARDSAAAPLFLALDTSKHSTTTVVDVPVGDETYALDIPTRHDMSYFGVGYEWQAARRVAVVPRIGWRTTEFSLAYNEILRSSFYRGVEIGVAGRFGLGPTPLSLDVGVELRPGISLGSTVRAFGDDASAFGMGSLVRLGAALPYGIRVSADARIDWYRTRYRQSGGDGSDATDLFQSFVVSVGYAI